MDKTTKSGLGLLLLAWFVFLVSVLLVVPTRITVGDRHHWHGMETELLSADPMFEAIAIEPWKEEISRRFPDAYVVFTHGTSLMGMWAMETPDGPASVQKYAEDLVAKYPDREIVFVVCNPGHYVINIPHVHYALDSVWMVPDRYTHGLFTISRSAFDPGVVGNIYEFQ